MIRRSIFTLAALPLLAGFFAASAAAQAPMPPQGPPPPGMERHGKGKHMDPAKMEQRRTERLNALKAKLQLTPAQEPAWTQFTSVAMARPNRPAERPDLSAMTTPERMAAMDKMRAAREAERDRREASVKAFYAQLTPAQQKVFDAEQAKMWAQRKERREQRQGG